MLNPEHSHVVRWPEDQKPLLMVIVDTEAEFDWKGVSRRAVGIRSASCQQRAQRIYDRFGVRPTYALDYPVSSNPDGYGPIREIYDSGGCLIGAHLQPWDTPPFTEFLSDLNSFPGNLPTELESAKLAGLTDTIAANVGVRPRIYKAGRYAVAQILIGSGANPASWKYHSQSATPGYWAGMAHVCRNSWAARESNPCIFPVCLLG